MNTIWDLKGLDGQVKNSFKEFIEESVVFFCDMFKEPIVNRIIDQLQVVEKFS